MSSNVYFGLLLLGFAFPAWAEVSIDPMDPVETISKVYGLDSNPDGLEALALKTKVECESASEAEHLAACGLINAAYAKSLGGMKGLRELKLARTRLEASVEASPTALSGFAIATLGRLYATVPRWPLSFGNDKKGEALLNQGLQNSPDSPFINLYLAYMYQEQDKGEDAKAALERAGTAAFPCECDQWQTHFRERIEQFH